MPLSPADLSEIERISRKKSVRKVSRTIIKDLDQEALSSLIASFIVLKAHGHSDSDFVKYVSTKSPTLKLGIKAGTSILPQLLTDSELRSLIMKTREQINKQKKRNQSKSERIKPQEKPPRVTFSAGDQSSLEETPLAES
jgi:hypothetical protein